MSDSLHRDPLSSNAFTIGGSSMPGAGNSMPAPAALQDLLRSPAENPDDSPDTPRSAKMPVSGAAVSPHRFMSSAALHEFEPRSRVNPSIQDEEGCIDITVPVVDVIPPESGLGNSFRLGISSPTSAPQAATFLSVPGETHFALSAGVGNSAVAAAIANHLGTPGSTGMPNAPSFVFSGDSDLDREANRELIVGRLRAAVHLSVLPKNELEILAEQLEISTPSKGTVVLPYGAVCKGVYVVLRGRVAVFKPDATVPNKFVSQFWLQRGDLFGFDAIVLRAHTARRYDIMTDDAVIGFFNYAVFFQLVQRNPCMAHSIARKLCEDMNAFKVFKEYARAVFAATVDPTTSVVVWPKVLDKFGKINNGIYPDMHADRLDTGAWQYALRRLPDNITRSLIVELAKAPPPIMASHMRKLSAEYDRNPTTIPKTTDGRISYVGCSVRRRPSFQLGHGKTLVLLRDSTTDLLDFISCMCVHLNESEKMRSRLLNMTDPTLIPLMERCISGSCSMDGIAETLAKLPFDEDERKGLLKLWGMDTMRNMFDIVTTRRDDLQVRVDMRSNRRFYRTPSYNMATSIRACILRCLGLSEDCELPPNLVVDLISSNAHGVKNIFSGFVRKHQAGIMKFAAENLKGAAQLNWHCREDLLYYASSKYLDTHSAARHDFTASLAQAGITVLEETNMTGLEVDVVQLRSVDPHGCDSYIADAVRRAKEKLESPFAAPHFIINMDFPFGSQAESVMKSLAQVFGHHIRSINIMGKGGGIVGRRGDVQFPTHVLFSKSSVPYDDFVDELRPIGQQDITLQQLRELVPDREVHHGPVLTIAGTMCQNSKLLRMYKHLWGCIGMEMEGSYFARAIAESVQQNVLRTDVKTRFLYYTSDTPLESEKESLAAGMSPTEGVPPLYAITRVFADAILRDPHN